MFEEVRRAFREVLQGTPPSGDARRSVLAQMRETLVQARMGVDDLKKGVEQTQQRLTVERRELETIQRRKTLAAGINDRETVAVAERFEKQHVERITVLERKLETQLAELALVEREVEEMTAELKLAAKGGVPGVAPGATDPSAAARAEVDDITDEAADLRNEIDGLARAQRRAAAEADADERLAALKRRMGK